MTAFSLIVRQEIKVLILRLGWSVASCYSRNCDLLNNHSLFREKFESCAVVCIGFCHVKRLNYRSHRFEIPAILYCIYDMEVLKRLECFKNL